MPQLAPGQVALYGGGGDNREVSNSQPTDNPANTEHPFAPGSIVVVTLGNPREKLWGAILGLSPEGLSLCGVELASFDDLVSMVKDGDAATPGVAFFPMHRVERIELDLPDGNVPSLWQRFAAKTGLDARRVLSPHADAMKQPSSEGPK